MVSDLTLYFAVTFSRASGLINPRTFMASGGPLKVMIYLKRPPPGVCGEGPGSNSCMLVSVAAGVALFST